MERTRRPLEKFFLRLLSPSEWYSRYIPRIAWLWCLHVAIENEENLKPLQNRTAELQYWRAFMGCFFSPGSWATWKRSSRIRLMALLDSMSEFISLFQLRRSHLCWFNPIACRFLPAFIAFKAATRQSSWKHGTRLTNAKDQRMTGQVCLKC